MWPSESLLRNMTMGERLTYDLPVSYEEVEEYISDSISLAELTRPFDQEAHQKGWDEGYDEGYEDALDKVKDAIDGVK